MIDSIRIENLRSLKDTGLVKIKPITILLGANSSGKSTFLRSFPLFTQSIKKDLRGPISWFDSSYVDFGDFKTAKNIYASENDGIKFSYRLGSNYPEYSLVRNIQAQYFYINRLYYRNLTYNLRNISLIKEFSFEISFDSGTTYVKRLDVKLCDLCLSMFINGINNDVQLFIDDKQITLNDRLKYSRVKQRKIFPKIFVVKGDNSIDLELYIYKYIATLLTQKINSRFKDYSRLNKIFEYEGIDKAGYLDVIKNGTTLKSLKDSVNDWTIDTPLFLQIYKLHIIGKLEGLISLCDMLLVQEYSSCGYIAPIRADANRYYRNQGLQIDDVDAYGRNLQEFIASLSRDERESYEQFIKNILEIYPSVENNIGHQSIILHKDKDKFNLADVGQGYSQIIPIITKLWHAVYISSKQQNKHKKRLKLLLMEQPELHLHPALQAKIADTFVNVVSDAYNLDRNDRLNLIIETHSQVIINRIGRRIREDKLSHDDVNVVLFQKDNLSKNTKVSQTSFNEKGQLKDWPWGFLDPED